MTCKAGEVHVRHTHINTSLQHGLTETYGGILLDLAIYPSAFQGICEKCLEHVDAHNAGVVPVLELLGITGCSLVDGQEDWALGPQLVLCLPALILHHCTDVAGFRELVVGEDARG